MKEPRIELHTELGLGLEEFNDVIDRTLREFHSSHWTRRSFLTALSITLVGCSSSSKHRGREGDNTGQQAALTVEDEKRMAQEALPSLQKEYPTLNNPMLNGYISDLGMKIARANGLENNPYHYRFSVVDVDFVNAFALPAGTIMVTAPLMALAESEAELAGVVGHEIGHVKARHTAERMEAAKRQQKKSLLYGIGGAILGGAAGYALGRAVCKKGDTQCQAKATLYGGAAGGGAGFLVSKFPFMANSREDEMEADRIGFRTSVQAGFHKDHVGLFYAKLLEMEKRSKGGGGNIPGLQALSDALSTHPPSQERVNQMKEMSQAEALRSNAIVSRPAFAEMKKELRKIGKAKPSSKS